MKKISLLLLLFNLHLAAWSQCEEDKNVRKYFDKQEFEKTIEKADKAIEKNAKEIGTYYLAAQAAFELFSATPTNDNYLKDALKYTYRVFRKDKDNACSEANQAFLDKLHTQTQTHARNLYDNEDERNKSKYFYDQLAKIFNDTTSEYLTFYPKNQDKKGLNENGEKYEPAANFTDENGKKQGLWRKLYENGKPAYEITFRNNVPVGDFKRFHENGQLKAHLSYDQQGKFAEAVLYNDTGSKVARGYYMGQNRDSVWFFYGPNEIKMAEEHYANGTRNGKSIKFYPNGNPSEERVFENGIENGVWRQFYENGEKELEARIEKDQRNGPFYKYYANGTFRVKGYYKDNLMHGEWVYFNEKGTPSKTIKYENGKPTTNLDLLEKEEKRYFEELQNNKGRIVDPEDYLNNPYEYTNKIQRGETIK